MGRRYLRYRLGKYMLRTTQQLLLLVNTADIRWVNFSRHMSTSYHWSRTSWRPFLPVLECYVSSNVFFAVWCQGSCSSLWCFPWSCHASITEMRLLPAFHPTCLIGFSRWCTQPLRWCSLRQSMITSLRSFNNCTVSKTRSK